MLYQPVLCCSYIMQLLIRLHVSPQDAVHNLCCVFIELKKSNLEILFSQLSSRRDLWVTKFPFGEPEHNPLILSLASNINLSFRFWFWALLPSPAPDYHYVMFLQVVKIIINVLFGRESLLNICDLLSMLLFLFKIMLEINLIAEHSLGAVFIVVLFKVICFVNCSTHLKKEYKHLN